MKKDLVLGTALNYEVDSVKNFVMSFREHNVNADIVLVTDAVSKEKMKDFFAEYKVKSLVFESYKFIDTSVNNVRLIKYLEFLQDNEDYRNVLLSDIRDVIFQSDPFNRLMINKLYFFNEDSGIPIGQEYHNSWWITLLYGDVALNIIRDRPIVCSGVIFGARNTVLKFLNIFKDEMLKIKPSGNFRDLIIDKGIVNYIANFYSKDQLDFEIRNNGDIVGTIGLSMTTPGKKDEVTFDYSTVRVNNKVPAIIHQYDRSPELAEYFSAKYKFYLR